jgi:Tol biopolymer transport system component
MALALTGGYPAVYGQYYRTGEDPAHLRWEQINTADYQLIFPAEYESKAIKIAGILNKVSQSGYKTLEHRPAKISIILHTQTAVSNGVVSWAPKRMELYTTPNQYIYPDDWLNQLCIHEYRHVVQMDKIESQLPALIRYLFGEQAAAMVAGVYVPRWFLEGDAVLTETAISNTGRGRSPLFLMDMKAQIVERGLYSFDKATMGSYRDHVPDCYRFGYWFTAGVRQTYGYKVWSEVLNNVARQPLSVVPLNKELKLKTGFSKQELYYQIFTDYSKQWSEEMLSRPHSEAQSISPAPAPHDYTNYRYVSAIDAGSFVALKETRRDIDRIVWVSKGKETTMRTPGTILPGSMSMTGTMLIRAEMRPDIRWTHATKSAIIMEDLQSGWRREFESNYNLQSPTISPDRKKIAAVEATFTNDYRLVIFDVSTGKVLKRFSTADNQYFMTPTWDDTSTAVFFVGLRQTGKYLGAIDVNSGVISCLTQPSFHDMRNPEYAAGKLYYTSSQTGIDNIFCLDLHTWDIRQITSSAFGADYASVSGNYLFYSDYSATGYSVSRLNLRENALKPLATVREAKYEQADAIAADEDGIFRADDSDNLLCLQIKPYHKFTHLFNFHSWGPLYINANDYEIKPGISFLSQNVLGTATAMAGYAYNPSERTGKFHADFEYRGLFPVFRAEFGYGGRKSAFQTVTSTLDTVEQRFSWHEMGGEFDVSVPLTFSSGKYTTLLQPRISWTGNMTCDVRNVPSQFASGFYHALSYGLLFRNQIRMAELDLYPDWGQTLNLTLRHGLSGGLAVNPLKAAELYLYFPGVAANHGIRWYGGMQIKGIDRPLSFADQVRFPRGITSIRNKQLLTSGIDYTMPLAYPDWNVDGLLYLKRLRTTAFFDVSRITAPIYDNAGLHVGERSIIRKSIGLDLIADAHMLRLVTPVAAGLRSIWLPDTRRWQFEFLLSINFGAL